MTEITFQNFKVEISDSEKPVLLFFYDTNADSIEQIDFSPLTEKAKLCKTNIADGGAVFASLYGILSIPTVLLLKNGKEFARHNGSLEVSALAALLSQNIQVKQCNTKENFGATRIFSQPSCVFQYKSLDRPNIIQ